MICGFQVEVALRFFLGGVSAECVYCLQKNTSTTLHSAGRLSGFVEGCYRGQYRVGRSVEHPVRRNTCNLQV
jgi:hypothetical protein